MLVEVVIYVRDSPEIATNVLDGSTSVLFGCCNSPPSSENSPSPSHRVFFQSGALTKFLFRNEDEFLKKKSPAVE